MSVGEYTTLAQREIDGLVDARGVAVVAGGTGLYLRAAIANLDIPPAVPTSERSRAETLYDADPRAAHTRLAELDAAAAALVHVNDRRRVVRALELVAAGSSLVPADGRLWSESMRRPTIVIGLDVSGAELERRIVARTDEMIRSGVAEEARRALRSPISHTARQALGLDELATLPIHEARDAIVARTRRYAAYQRKWMRRIPGVVLIDADRPPEQVADDVLDLARPR
jgi:tRNA dimethylallyltransferase